MSDCCSHNSKPVSEPSSPAAQKSCCEAVVLEPTGSSCCLPASEKSAHGHNHSHEHHTHVHEHYAQAVVSSCCEHDHDHDQGGGLDYLLWGSLLVCATFYGLHLLAPSFLPEGLRHFAHSIFEMLNAMWWGVLLGLVFVGLLAKVPQNLVLGVLGKGGTFSGLARATMAGILLDLCSHGILMVGMKLYQKGASLGQVMAFLIASPWNSFSLTLIMFALIGFKWTLIFIVTSMVIALISGWLFDLCVAKKILPENPRTYSLDENFAFWPEAKRQWRSINWSWALVRDIAREGLSGSRMVLRWLLFGVVLAALVRGFVSLEFFQQWFGPSLIGMVFTLVAATVIEVCSEGSAPIAADLMNRALAPGNAFTFMMAGVSTDYTEVMVLKDTTKSWKIALFLPLITLPQIVVVGYLMNNIS